MPIHPRQRDTGNTLLDRLPADEYEALAPSLQPVDLAHRQVVHQHDAEVVHVYFPTTAMVSLLIVMEEDDPVEAMTVGHDGVVGLAAALGVEASPYRAFCQIAGRSLRLPSRAFRDAMRQGPALSRVVHAFLAYSLRAVGQGLACNALHPVEARACRWLLACHDRVQAAEFPMTHEFLASMLGVRRQSVTVVAGTLQGAGLIAYRRGLITILDRPRLEEAACECYDANRRYYDRVLA